MSDCSANLMYLNAHVNEIKKRKKKTFLVRDTIKQRK